MYQCLIWKHVTVPGKKLEVASPFWKESAPKQAVLKERIELIVYVFGWHVLTTIPPKL